MVVKGQNNFTSKWLNIRKKEKNNSYFKYCHFLKEKNGNFDCFFSFALTHGQFHF